MDKNSLHILSGNTKNDSDIEVQSTQEYKISNGQQKKQMFVTIIWY